MVFVNLGPFLIREVSSFKGCPLRGVPLYVCTYIYHITGYLYNPEICAFWQKMSICGFYLCVALHGVWSIFTVDINYICAISV